MKKITLALTLLLAICAMGFAWPFSFSGSSTLEWGYAGTITDNSANFAGEIPTGDLFTDDSGKHEITPDEIKLTVEVADEDGTVIVKAESKLDLEDEVLDLVVDDAAYRDAFQFIEFPNVIPGMLGIWLGKSDDVETSVTASGSSTKSPEVIATITPVDGLTAKLGFVMDQNTLEYNDWDDPVAQTTLENSFSYATYTNIAISIFAEYEAMLGDEDSVTVGVGTVYDTAWGKAVVQDPDDLDAADVTAGWLQEKYLAQTIVAADEALVEITDTYGYATMPLGVAVGAAVGDLSAALEFQTRLVQGSDTANVQGDTTDGMEIRAFEMPMYIGVDLGYEMMAGDITITPNANFKWVNDFWKWGYDAGDEVWEYEGLVSGADYVGRPMSASVGVDVDGIAGMIDLSISAGLGFGDGAYDHGNTMLLPLVSSDGLYAPTLAALLADTQDANDGLDNDDINNVSLVSSTGATEIAVGLTVMLPMVEGLSIMNDFSYITDGLGILGDTDEVGTLFADFFTEITNDTVVEYDLMVGDAVACTFFGKLMYEMITPQVEFGSVFTADTFLPADATEQASKSTMSYELGVKATVSF